MNAKYKVDMLVSVVIPTFNREKTIRRCVNSVINQAYPVFEIIVVDDGSADQTLDILQSEYKDSVKIVKQVHKGAQAARNAGICAAEGEYIVFLDSDDCLTPTSIEDRIKVFKDRSDIDMVYGDFVSGNRICRFDKIQNFNSREYLLEELSLCGFSSIMVRKNVFIDVPLLDINYKSWQDDDFVLQLEMHNKKTFHCGKVVARVYVGNSNISSNYNSLYEGCKRIVNKYAKEIVREISVVRLLMWKVRILRNWIRKTSKNKNKFISEICKIMYVCLDKICNRYFRHVWG